MTPVRIISKSGIKIREPDFFTRLEIVSAKALVGYVARNRNMHEDFVQKMLLDHFKVKEIEQMPRNLYDEMIRFLVDLPANNR